MKTSLALAWTLALAPLMAPPALAAPEAGLQAKLQTIEQSVEARRQALHIPGAALAIVKDGRVIYMHGFGERDLAHHKPVTPDTLFAIGSCTKAFTAMACEIAQDDGKLSIDDSPKKFLPYFKLQDSVANEKITMRDMLCHRSGVARMDLGMLTGKLSRKELIQLLADAKPVSKFRTGFNYQNLMFAAAGEIAGQAEGMPYEQLVTTRILAPLGMRRVCWTPQAMQADPDFSLGYDYNRDTGRFRQLPMRDITPAAPAGAINASAREMASWVQCMLDGGLANGKRLVSERGFHELLTPQNRFGPGAYGLGWMLEDFHGHKVAEHDGNIDGFNAEVGLMPDQHLGFVLLTNVSSSPLDREILDLVWKPLLGLPTEPAGKIAAKVDPAATKALLGDYRMEKFNAPVAVILQDDQPAVSVPGQPPYPLVPTKADTYRLAGTPDGFFVTVERDAHGQMADLLLTQPNGKFVLKRAVPYQAPLTIDQLMEKRIAAEGGREALAKHHSLIEESRFDFVNQGISGTGTTRLRAPNASESVAQLMALGKPIGFTREYTDGQVAGSESSFGLPERKTGKSLADALAGADFEPLLDWKTRLASTAITGTVKVAGEDCYEIKEHVAGGDDAIEYVSTHSFLLLKRTTMVSMPNADTTYPDTEFYSDYRPVDGVMLPFAIRSQTIGEGTLAITLTTARFDQPIPPHTFEPGQLAQRE